MTFLESASFDWMDILNFDEKPFRAKLIPAKVWVDLDSYRNNQVGLSNYVRKWRTKIEWKKEKSKAKWAENYVAIGGEYSILTFANVPSISIQKFNTFPFTDRSWNHLSFA
jgi:hypothetical protein